MKFFSRYLVPLFSLALTASAAHAQALGFLTLHNVDLGGNAIGQFTPIVATNTGFTQSTTDSFGGNFSIRAHPKPWAGVEFNYAFTEFQEKWTASYEYDKVKTDMHEATAAYIFHPHFRKLQPFVNIGGGYIDFVPVQGQNQWRGTGLLEVGLDIPTSNPHFGFRAQARTLVYRNPNYNYFSFGTADWVATTEPAFGAWIRF
jgi:hypothetical protein